MVLAERNSELVRNGRRSRGPSPNGHGTSSAGGGSSTGGGGGGGGVGGAGTPENSSDDDNSIKRNGKSKAKQSEYEEKIRVGRDYQAVCPPLVPEPERKPEVLNDRALLVWSPTKEIPDPKLDDYISVAKEKYGYNGEQALGMLFWHKHDLERAVMDLANFTPFPDEWTAEDKILFEQAFQFHGKSFHRIRQMLPDKSIASLVKYYYSWKKTRHRHSVMDRQEKAKASKEGSENGSENGSNEESDNDDKDQALASTSGLQDQMNSKLNAAIVSLSKHNSKCFDIANEADIGESESSAFASASVSVTASATTSSAIDGGAHTVVNSPSKQRQQTPPNSNDSSSCTGGRTTPSNGVNAGDGDGAGGSCTNCGVACNLLHTSPDGKLCASCHHHWRRTGNNRPTSGPYFGKRSNAERHKRKPPRGMYINHDDIVALASGNDNQDDFLAEIEREIASLLSQVQMNKQSISSLKRKNSEALEDIRPAESGNRINPRWTTEELSLAIQGIRKYGKDFQTIAEIIGTKTEAHVRTFYVSYRRRYNLDQELKKFEAEREASATAAAANSSAAPSEVAGSKTDEIKEKETPSTTSGSSIATTNAVEESDNTTSSEATAASKSILDEAKIANSNSNSTTTQDDNVIMEIDLDADQGDSPPPLQPSPKKIALTMANQEYPEASPV